MYVYYVEDLSFKLACLPFDPCLLLAGSMLEQDLYMPSRENPEPFRKWSKMM